MGGEPPPPPKEACAFSLESKFCRLRRRKFLSLIIIHLSGLLVHRHSHSWEQSTFLRAKSRPPVWGSRQLVLCWAGLMPPGQAALWSVLQTPPPCPDPEAGGLSPRAAPWQPAG